MNPAHAVLFLFFLTTLAVLTAHAILAWRASRASAARRDEARCRALAAKAARPAH